MRTKNEELQYINQLQESYVDELLEQIKSKDNAVFKEINLTSPTGTGKTIMMAKLINKCPDWFFIVTTLSHGQLHLQVEAEIRRLCHGGNYIVYGVSSFTKNTRLTADDILNTFPSNRQIIWLRDEGHRNTNNWMALLEDRCYKIVNISATNKSDHGVVCNFTDTMMLRSVKQSEGDAINAVKIHKKIKTIHSTVGGYTPCILFRVTSIQAAKDIVALCREEGIPYINLVGFDDYDMSELCKDDCTIEAIIYMQKMDVGIDIRRAHTIWIQTKPSNVSTTIQCVGRCRRNALFWRNDIDIMDPKNRELLEETRVCYAVYQIEGTQVSTNEFGEMVNTFCPYISVQRLRAGCEISVIKGTLANGLNIIELQRRTGQYRISKDEATGFNIVDNESFYRQKTKKIRNHLSNPRLDALFTPPENVCSAIRTTVDRLNENPHLDIIFGFDCQSKPHNKAGELVIPGFYKATRIPCLINSKTNPNSDETSLGFVNAKRKYYKTSAEFYADITQNYLYKKDCTITSPYEHLKQYPAFETVKQLINFAKCCGDQDSEYPMTITKQTLQSAFEHYRHIIGPLSYIVQDPYEITPETNVFRHGYDYYSFEECKRIALYNSIAPQQHQYYSIIDTNCELATIGPELFQRINKSWKPVVSVTKLLTSNTKFKRFIHQRYETVINQARPYFYKRKNLFDFEDRRQNSILGCCVEYYAKFLLYKDYLGIPSNSKKKLDSSDIIRLCLEKYKDMMSKTFGNDVAQRIRLPSTETLGSKQYQSFLQACMTLGKQTEYALQRIFECEEIFDKEYDPVLSTRHLRGLMDIVTHDTIVDIKVTSEINERMLLQVLAYHYLSTLRSDLAVDRVVIYDAACNRCLSISGLRSGKLQINVNYKNQ